MRAKELPVYVLHAKIHSGCKKTAAQFQRRKDKVMSPISLQRHAFDLSSQNNATRSTTIPEKHGSDAEPLPNLKGTQTKTRETMIENFAIKDSYLTPILV